MTEIVSWQPIASLSCNLQWRGLREDTEIPAAVTELAKADGVMQWQWKP